MMTDERSLKHDNQVEKLVILSQVGARHDDRREVIETFLKRSASSSRHLAHDMMTDERSLKPVRWSRGATFPRTPGARHDDRREVIETVPVTDDGDDHDHLAHDMMTDERSLKLVTRTRIANNPGHKAHDMMTDERSLKLGFRSDDDLFAEARRTT